MRLPRPAWVLILALFFLFNLIVSAPARLLEWMVPVEQLSLQGLSGTLWQGSASSVMLHLPQGYLTLGEVEWSLRPLSLLMLSPHLTVSSTWGSQIVEGELILRGEQDLDVLNLEVRVAAELLRQVAPLSVDGHFVLQLKHLELRKGLPHSADGHLVWNDGAWRSPRGQVPLGSYALQISQAPGEELLGEVETITGQVEAGGYLELRGRHYVVDILLSGEDGLDQQLQQMLGMIAAPEGDDYRISVEGDF